jgi:hypothetical protein
MDLAKGPDAIRQARDGCQINKLPLPARRTGASDFDIRAQIFFPAWKRAKKAVFATFSGLVDPIFARFPVLFVCCQGSRARFSAPKFCRNRQKD